MRLISWPAFLHTAHEDWFRKRNGFRGGSSWNGDMPQRGARRGGGGVDVAAAKSSSLVQFLFSRDFFTLAVDSVCFSCLLSPTLFSTDIFSLFFGLGVPLGSLILTLFLFSSVAFLVAELALGFLNSHSLSHSDSQTRAGRKCGGSNLWISPSFPPTLTTHTGVIPQLDGLSAIGNIARDRLNPKSSTLNPEP